jgi:HK97 family phage prohead protease
MKTGFSQKSIGLKDIDIQDRIVKGYFAAFDNIDSDNDVIRKGAFAKSIQEHGPGTPSNRKIAHLLFHDTTRPIGSLTTLEEDSKGLYFVSELGTHQDGEDALRMYKEGIIREHSIGFQYLADKMRMVEDNGKTFFEINEVKLFEGSAVVFGANSETPNMTEIKNQEDLNNALDSLKERSEVFVKALKDGNYSEKFNGLFEVELSQIFSKYESLVKHEPFDKNTLAEEPEDRTEFYNEIIKRL